MWIWHSEISFMIPYQDERGSIWFDWFQLNNTSWYPSIHIKIHLNLSCHQNVILISCHLSGIITTSLYFLQCDVALISPPPSLSLFLSLSLSLSLRVPLSSSIGRSRRKQTLAKRIGPVRSPLMDWQPVYTWLIGAGVCYTCRAKGLSRTIRPLTTPALFSLCPDSQLLSGGHLISMGGPVLSELGAKQ